jgi:hypothetical protein
VALIVAMIGANVVLAFHCDMDHAREYDAFCKAVSINLQFFIVTQIECFIMENVQVALEQVDLIEQLNWLGLKERCHCILVLLNVLILIVLICIKQYPTRNEYIFAFTAASISQLVWLFFRYRKWLEYAEAGEDGVEELDDVARLHAVVVDVPVPVDRQLAAMY